MLGSRSQDHYREPCAKLLTSSPQVPDAMQDLLGQTTVNTFICAAIAYTGGKTTAASPAPGHVSRDFVSREIHMQVPVNDSANYSYPTTTTARSIDREYWFDRVG